MRKTYVFLLVSILLIVLSGCKPDQAEEVKPTDELSETICEKTDGAFIYEGNKTYYEDALVYCFYIKEITRDNVSVLVNTANSFELKSDHKVKICIETWIPEGIGGLCAISNYYPLPDETYNMYPDLCVYTICWQDLGSPEVLDPNLFTGVEGIKYLIVADKMNEKAKEQGIDWYEIWPDLEGVEVFSVK